MSEGPADLLSSKVSGVWWEAKGDVGGQRSHMYVADCERLDVSCVKDGNTYERVCVTLCSLCQLAAERRFFVRGTIPCG